MADVDSDSDFNGQRKSDPEVTLGMASLLAIFFGLVILCGIFFGFGYTVGKRFTAPSTRAATQAPKNAPAADDTAQPTDESQPAKPSADGKEMPPPAKAAPLPAESAKNPATPSAPATTPKPRVPPTEEATAPARPERNPANSAFPDYMVQVAAVSRPADSDALIAALRKLGYNVIAHTEPQDKLLHVQIGPFTTRAEANAMRQKLLADGYNAIIK
jgi:DedD protein